MSTLMILAEGSIPQQPVSASLWVGTLMAIAAIFAFDTLVLGRDHFHAPSMKKTGLTLVFYACLAACMAVFLWKFTDLGAVGAQEFVSGYFTEWSLSVDNLFVFLLLFLAFAVPREYQSRGLTFGIMGAIVLRLIAIQIGYALLQTFAIMGALFGVFLLITAYKVIKSQFEDEEEEDVRESRIYKVLIKYIPTTPDYHADKLTAVIKGKRYATPLLMVVVCMAFFDLLFALDSVPAVLAVTQNNYVAFVATAFALMGMRQVFFFLSAVQDKVVGLNLGLGVILAFVGLKMIVANHKVVSYASALFGFLGIAALANLKPYEVSPSVGLCFIFVVLVIVAGVSVASYLRNRDKVTLAEKKILDPNEIALEVYLGSGRTLDGEWETGLMRDYATEAVRVGGRYDTGEGINVYGAADRVEALATVQSGFLVDVPRPELGDGPAILNALNHASALARETIGRVVAVIVTDARGDDEQSIREAFVTTPDNLFVVFVYVSDEPGGAELLQRLDQFNVAPDVDRCETIIATNDDGTPRQRIDKEIGRELTDWLALTAV